MLVFDRGGCKEQLSLKTSVYARFRGRRGWKRATRLENKHVCLFSREEGGGGGKEQLPSKTSAYACFWGIRVVVKATSLENEPTCSLSREKGGGKE